MRRLLPSLRMSIGAEAQQAELPVVHRHLRVVAQREHPLYQLRQPREALLLSQNVLSQDGLEHRVLKRLL